MKGEKKAKKTDNEEDFSLENQRLYPHFKLTDEKFPRLLVTRKIAADNAEYFGAFLPETGVRFLIDFLNKTFRLRACEIEIDGSFDVPCPQFYRKRCVAPCVRSLCDEKTYANQVNLVRLFLTRNKAELENYFLGKIERFSENLDFESAKETHETWQTIAKVFADKDWNFWLDDATDTFELEESDELFLVHLVTMRARKSLGKRTFVFEKTGEKEEILSAVLRQFYRLHAPKEIRVSRDFPDRFLLANELSLRFKRKISINVVNENQPKILTERALDFAKFQREFRLIKRSTTLAEIQAELKKDFALKQKPRRIEAFDVAHISGKDFVAAKAVWQDGKFVGKESEFWFSDEESELETLRKFVEFRFAKAAKNFPDLVLIDGGKSHLAATLKGVENLANRTFAIISAVKPPRQHESISRFLTERGNGISFDAEKPSHLILQKLRDAAHDFSNEIHRQRREFSHFYELAQILPSLTERERLDSLKNAGSIKRISELTKENFAKFLPAEKAAKAAKDLVNYQNGESKKVEPFIVPLRFAENGDAEDLRPLTSYNLRS